MARFLKLLQKLQSNPGASVSIRLHNDNHNSELIYENCYVHNWEIQKTPWYTEVTFRVSPENVYESWGTSPEDRLQALRELTAFVQDNPDTAPEAPDLPLQYRLARGILQKANRALERKIGGTR